MCVYVWGKGGWEATMQPAGAKHTSSVVGVALAGSGRPHGAPCSRRCCNPNTFLGPLLRPTRPADLYVDNERLIRVEGALLAQALPAKLRAYLRDERLPLGTMGSHPGGTLQTGVGGGVVSVRKAPIVKSRRGSPENTSHGGQLLQPLLSSV